MEDIQIREFFDMKSLDGFFAANDLEFSEEHPVETDRVKSWAILEDEAIVAGIALALRQGEYIIDGIAVREKYRKEHLGEKLLSLAVDEVKNLGGKRIYLVAKALGFFRKNGFLTVPRESAPNFFECLTCDRCGVTCHPEVMLLEV